MQKKYFIWKNGIKATNGVQEWEEISPNDFIEISKANKNLPTGEKRYFYRIAPAESDDTYYFFECSYEHHKENSRTTMKEDYKRKKERQDTEYEKYQIISMDYEYDGDDGNILTLHDFIPDFDSLFEEKNVTEITIENVLSVLSSDEYEIIYRLFLSKNTVSERELAKKMGVPKTTLHNKKMKILEKIKNFLDQND